MATDYKQYDYPSTPYAAETIATAGCGPTSVADLLDVEPPITAEWLEAHGYAYPYQGTIYEGISACLTAFGADGDMLCRDQDYQVDNEYFREWRQRIMNGQSGVILFHNCVSSYWTSGGHYVAVVRYDREKDEYLVYDPASVVRTGWHPFYDFAENISALYTSSKRWDNGDIAEDSFWGKETTRRAQEVFCSGAVDGLVSNQNRDMKKFLPNCQTVSWRFVTPTHLKTGSDLIRAIQRYLGIEPDGFCGMQTVVSLQKFLGVEPDGYFGGLSVLAFQRWLNKQ